MYFTLKWRHKSVKIYASYIEIFGNPQSLSQTWRTRSVFVLFANELSHCFPKLNGFELSTCKSSRI